MNQDAEFFYESSLSEWAFLPVGVELLGQGLDRSSRFDAKELLRFHSLNSVAITNFELLNARHLGELKLESLFLDRVSGDGRLFEGGHDSLDSLGIVEVQPWGLVAGFGHRTDIKYLVISANYSATSVAAELGSLGNLQSVIVFAESGVPMVLPDEARRSPNPANLQASGFSKDD